MAQRIIDTQTLRQTQTAAGSEEEAARKAPWSLRVLRSPDRSVVGGSYPIVPELTLGRLGGAQVSLVVGDPNLSRMHLSLRRCGNEAVLQVTDHESKNGTWLNGERLLGAVYAAAGAVLRMGNTLAVVEDAPAAGPDAADAAFLGASPATRLVVEQLRKLAPGNLPVLLEGETGSGKEVAARRLHDLSGRRGGYVAVNCAALPEHLVESALFGHVRGAFTGATAENAGLVAAAAGGTLFLDEVGELPLELQPKLLRLLENAEYAPVGSSRTLQCTARIVAATNRSLHAEVERGAFRLDLLARLQGYRLELPPLRERRGDILLLLERFWADSPLGRAGALTTEAAEALLLYGWPMNVRELRQLAHRLALLHTGPDPIRAAALPPEMRVPSRSLSVDPASAAEALPRRGTPDRETLIRLLRESGGNVQHLANVLHRDRKQVYRWLERYGIQPDDYREGG
jgi:transcriptional regulator with GAF, ATPase, and Fis domain